MLFARWPKWLGGRGESAESDEPARFTPPQTPAPSSTQAPEQKAGKPKSHSAQGKGFDPYNSGAFKRLNAWERVNRR